MARRIYKEFNDIYTKDNDFIINHDIQIEYIPDTIYNFYLKFKNPLYLINEKNIKNIKNQKNINNKNEYLKIKCTLSRNYPFSPPKMIFIDPPSYISNNIFIIKDNLIFLEQLWNWSPATKIPKIIDLLSIKIIETTHL